MTHPSSLDFEAFACGEPNDSVVAHSGACAARHAFVERLRGALSAGPSRARAAEAGLSATGGLSLLGERARSRVRPERPAPAPSTPTSETLPGCAARGVGKNGRP